ncbi:hypothetical protein B0H10DRAFT_1956652 [Mycena sp. CBHHK59/15]|nr:hypothetical protein B0H10DRAFT_1956652 [Mycena sp. CBHHK59/15]
MYGRLPGMPKSPRSHRRGAGRGSTITGYDSLPSDRTQAPAVGELLITLFDPPNNLHIEVLGPPFHSSDAHLFTRPSLSKQPHSKGRSRLAQCQVKPAVYTSPAFLSIRRPPDVRARNYPQRSEPSGSFLNEARHDNRRVHVPRPPTPSPAALYQNATVEDNDESSNLGRRGGG